MSENGKTTVGLNVNVDVSAETSDKLAETFIDLIGPLTEGAAYLRDGIKYYRFSTAVKILERARQIMAESSISPCNLPIKFLVPFLESCSLEEEVDLEEMWARLLSHSAKSFDSRAIAFIDVLKRINAKDAERLVNMWRKPLQFDQDFWIPLKQARSPKVPSIAGAGLIDGTSYIEIDENSIDKYGRVILMDYLETKSGNIEKRSVHSRLKNPEKEYSEMRLLERLDLVSIYGIGHASEEGSFFCFWAELSQFGLEFVEHCEGRS